MEREEVENQIREDFKLLAIQPLPGCNPDYCKVLEPGRVYKFYQDYTFKQEHSLGDVLKITSPSEPIPELYDQEKLNICISAIVGKNGSGKSTLIELLYYATYCLGVSLGHLQPKSFDLLKEKRDLESASNTSSQIDILDKKIQDEGLAHKEILNTFKASVFYSLNDVLYELRIDSNLSQSEFPVEIKGDLGSTKAKEERRNHTIRKLLLNPSDNIKNQSLSNTWLFKHFFFTVSLNYSHYALNSVTMGSWISRLFHKNDAYYAPISINPMRTEGNFNINNENNFAAYRLLFNLLLQQQKAGSSAKVMLTDNQCVDKVLFSLNSTKVAFSKDASHAISLIELGLIESIRKVYFVNNLPEDIPFKDYIEKYIAKKVWQIVTTYSDQYPKEYEFLEKGESDKFEDVLKYILDNDNSHITFKLKQAIYYINSWNTISKELSSRWKSLRDGAETIEFTLEELLTWTDDATAKDLMQRLPPPIFSIDYKLANSYLVERNLSTFNKLSSGEQQFIHTIQGILYHINNLRSAHDRDNGLMAYQAINIIIDEIELYFHPELQRQFVKRLLSSIERLQLSSKDITNINILLSTHSPFILSDIPRQNVLALKQGQNGRSIDDPISNETFGANVHDLLAHEFFLDNGFMGEFAEGEILSAINFLQSTIKKETPSENSRWNKISLDRFIQLIGEPLLRKSLNGLYEEAYVQNVDEINEQILRLQKRKEQQAKQQRSDDSDTN